VYTKLDDMRIAKNILLYVEQNPSATRKNIMQYFSTNMRRLKQLEADGYLTMPLPMPREIRNKEYRENKAIQSTHP